MKRPLALCLISLFVFTAACQMQAQNNFTLNALWSIAPTNTSPPVDTSFNQRGMAYDPVSGNLVFVDTHSGQNGSSNVLGGIYVLEGSTGNQLGSLSTNGIVGGDWADFAAAVADDGAVYVCNHVASSTNLPFTIYRWASVTNTDPPTVAFSGTLSPSQRYGSSVDIRGGGADTQIIIGSIAGRTGTNVVIFTTVNGTTFTENVIGCTNVTSQNFNDGIAFGPGNTFWGKRLNSPLLYMAYDLTAKTARVLASYNNTNIAGVLGLGPITVDTNNNLLAAIEVSGASERVWLLDISDTNRLTVLSFASFTPNYPNATAPAGYLDFGGGRLYAHVSNNGLLVNSVDSISTPLPAFDRNLPATNRVAAGQTAHFEVLAYPKVTGYQWRTNGGPITGATNFFLNVTNVQLSDSGRTYSVVVSNAAGTTDSANSVLSVVNAADIAHLDLLWAAPVDNAPYMDNGGQNANERSFAYSTFANQLYVVRRVGIYIKVFAIDPDTGAVLYNLRTDGITVTNVTIPLLAIAVAEDGAIYACNAQDAANGNNFKIYRWADSDANTAPVNIFTGSPNTNLTSTTFRWGDALDVRGSGTNTLILIDNQDNTSTLTRYICLLRPTSTDLNQPWSPKPYLVSQNNDGSALTGRSLQFGIGDTFWQKRMPQTPNGTALIQSSFDLNNPDLLPVAPFVQQSPPTAGQPMATNGPTGVDNSGSNLGASVRFSAGITVAGTSPDVLELYDLGNLATPVLLNSYNFPVNHLANSLPNAQTIFADGYLFALSGNNGIMAYTFALGPVSTPKFLLQPKNTRILKGNTNSLVVVLDQNVPLQWQKDTVNITNATNATLTIPGQFTNAGSYRVVATNSSGASTSVVVTVSIGAADDNYSLTRVWSKTATGLGSPTTNYVSSSGGAATPNERGFGYNALSNQVLVIQRQGSASSSYIVHVVDGDTGTKLYELPTTGISNTIVSEVSGANGIGLVDMAAADDGALYGCNSSPNSSGGTNLDNAKKFRIYRWANSGSNTTPTGVFAGDPSGQVGNVRYGDQLAVRGNGIITELLTDANEAAGAGIIKPTDGTLSTFFSYPLSLAGFNGSIGRNLQFGPTNTLWQKRRGQGLELTRYETNTGNSTVLSIYPSFPQTLGPLAIDTTRNIAVGVDFASPHAAVLYDMSDPNAPMLVAKYDFPTSGANNNSIGKIIFSGNKVFALNGNNGIQAFTIQSPVGRPNLSIAQADPNALISWGTNHVGWTLQSTASLTPPSWSNVVVSPGVVGTNYVSTNAISGTAFYRLVQ